MWPKLSVRRALLLALILGGCSASPPSKFNPDELRARSDSAFETRAKRRAPQVETQANNKPKEAQARPAQAPLADQGCAELGCLDLNTFFAAEGLGETERAAQEDATARLSARIESEIESVVRSQYSESAAGSESKNSIERAVKTSFKYGELIRYLPARGEAPTLAVVAYFKKSDYQARLKRDYGASLEDLRFQLQDAVAPGASPSLFVQVWAASQEQLRGYQRYAQLHKAVMGELPSGAQEVEELIRSAERIRRRTLSRVTLVINYKGSPSAELQGALSSLLQGMLSGWQLRSRVGEVCPTGGYKLEVDSDQKTSTHLATGTPMIKFKWSVSILSCADQGVISRAQLPNLSGVERANKSAELALIAEVNRIKGYLSSGRAVSNEQLKKKLDALSKGLYQVLSESFPISARAAR